MHLGFLGEHVVDSISHFSSSLLQLSFLGLYHSDSVLCGSILTLLRVQLFLHYAEANLSLIVYEGLMMCILSLLGRSTERVLVLTIIVILVEVLLQLILMVRCM